MATSYKSVKPKNLKCSVLWILGFDLRKNQKVKEQEVDLSMLRSTSCSMSFGDFGFLDHEMT